MSDVKLSKESPLGAAAEAPTHRSAATDPSGESRLRGAALDGAKRDSSVDPDAVLHVDDETDSLYDDGLDLEDEGKTLISTDGGGNSKP